MVKNIMRQPWASNVFGLPTAVNLVLHNCGVAASRL